MKAPWDRKAFSNFIARIFKGSNWVIHSYPADNDFDHLIFYFSVYSKLYSCCYNSPQCFPWSWNDIHFEDMHIGNEWYVDKHKVTNCIFAYVFLFLFFFPNKKKNFHFRRKCFHMEFFSLFWRPFCRWGSSARTTTTFWNFRGTMYWKLNINHLPEKENEFTNILQSYRKNSKEEIQQLAGNDSLIIKYLLSYLLNTIRHRDRMKLKRRIINWPWSIIPTKGGK